MTLSFRRGARRRIQSRGLLRIVLPLVCALAVTACDGGGEPTGEPLRITVPAGAGLSAVTDTLVARGVVDSGWRFKLFARRRGADRPIQRGIYEVRPGESWDTILDRLESGDVVKMRLVIPEGWMATQIAARVAEQTGVPVDSVVGIVADEGAPERFGVPGPTLEGYLYPATYELPMGTPPEGVVRTLVNRYKRAWTPRMRARADSLGMSEREVVTLASIVEKEARDWRERPRIAAVYHNRLRRGMRLEADPTVQYALGEHQGRLLYAHIRETADNPYNTYRNAGLPPGPIASPSTGAIEATLWPEEHDFLFFVARPNGTHVFTRNFQEHTAARRRVRAEARAAAAARP